MCTKCIDKMTAYEIYNIVRERFSSLPELKQELSDLKGSLNSMVREMTSKDISVDFAKKANKARKTIESLSRDIRCIEICSKDADSLKNRSERSGKASFRECVLQFVKAKEGASFEPVEVAKFVADVRGQALTSSVRVFTHRVLKDMVLQNHIMQISHGLYSSIKNSVNISV